MLTIFELEREGTNFVKMCAKIGKEKKKTSHFMCKIVVKKSRWRECGEFGVEKVWQKVAASRFKQMKWK